MTAVYVQLERKKALNILNAAEQTKDKEVQTLQASYHQQTLPKEPPNLEGSE